METAQTRARKRRCCPVFPNKPQQRGAGLVLRESMVEPSSGQIASFRGSSTTGQDSYSSQGSKSMQMAGSRFPSKSQVTVSLRTVRRSRKMAWSRRGANTPPFSSRGRHRTSGRCRRESKCKSGGSARRQLAKLWDHFHGRFLPSFLTPVAQYGKGV